MQGTSDERAVVVYGPQSRLRAPLRFLREASADLWAARALGWRLFLRNFRVQYRGSLFGYLWTLLPPLVGMGVWVFLNRRILSVGETPIPYPLYVLLGNTLWSLFTASVQCPLAAVRNGRSMLVRVRFPVEALFLAGLAKLAFGVLLQLVPLAAVYAWCGVRPPWTLVFFPFCLLAVCAGGFSLGMLVLPLATLYKDVARLVKTALGLCFFLTPVVYPPPTEWPLSLLAVLNPIAPLVVVGRDLATRGETSLLVPFLWVCGAEALLLLVAWLIFRLSLPYLVERMKA